jgi:hypothetical protein
LEQRNDGTHIYSTGTEGGTIVTIITVILTVLGFLAGAVIGGFLARKQAGYAGWTMDDEIQWWIRLIKGDFNAR